MSIWEEEEEGIGGDGQEDNFKDHCISSETFARQTHSEVKMTAESEFRCRQAECWLLRAQIQDDLQNGH